MTAPLLKTKFYVPPVRATWVRRPRLLRRLDEGLRRRLTLISAPAGFGKTTLLSDWAGQGDRLIGWLSLDEDDNAPARFWTYVVSALRTTHPGLGESTLGALQSPQPPPIESLLTDLINDIATIPEPLTLILDDYHLIAARPVHDGLEYFLGHLPRPLHLVIATRTDPPLPLHLLRARRQLTELRAVDLRFTSEETAAFLNEVMGLDLPAELVEALERRTEGWITGLQLAALSMGGRDDVAGFVRAFAGDHRYVLDYLAEEVLRRQPEPLQAFLLRTSILSRMTGSLCDAVTGQTGGVETLEALERDNLFVVPLDDERRWYRYHHLFAQVLRAFLQRTAGREGVASLHLRAAGWYEVRGEANEAFKHALAAGDVEGAARLIEENWLRVGHAGHMHTILQWLEAMPESVLRARPLLSLAYAWALWLTGCVDDVEPQLDAAAAGWDREEAAGVADPARARWRAGAVALRLQLTRHRGQLAETIRLARETLVLAPRDDALAGGYGHLGLAHAHRELGDYEAARSAYAEGMRLMRAAGNLSSASLAAYYLSRVLQIQGRPEEALEVVREATAFIDAWDETEPPARGILHVARAALLCDRHELQEAEDHARRGLEMSRSGGHHVYLRNAAIVMARLRLARGDAVGALEAIGEAARVTPKDGMPLPAAELAAYQARAWLAQGQIDAAARWAAGAAERSGEDDGPTRYVEATTRARVVLAQDGPDEALELLAECREAAERKGARGWAVELGVLRALAEEARGRRAEALAALREALQSASPSAYARHVVDGGRDVATLLAALLAMPEREAVAAMPGVSRETLHGLLDLVGAAGAAEPGAAPGASPLVEPLTEREMEVLRLMAAGLSNRQIAEELIIALGTVKSHLHHIYGKLGVSGRTEAAARARELHLL